MSRSWCSCSKILIFLPIFLTISAWLFVYTNKPVKETHNIKDFLTDIHNKIIPPPVGSINLTKSGRNQYSQEGQDLVVDKLLGNKKNGFYIECGAMDGQYFSNTLFLELKRGWTGLLIEANPVYYKRLVQTQRQSYIINACLSPTNDSTELLFQMNRWKGMTGLAGKEHNGESSETVKETPGTRIKILCHPLYIFLQAMGRTHVDYFSLDVEGAELGVLKTIPWDKITIDVLTVEYNVPGEPSLPRLNQIIEFMLGTGLYEVVDILPREKPLNLGLDVVFQRKKHAK